MINLCKHHKITTTREPITTLVKHCERCQRFKSKRRIARPPTTEFEVPNNKSDQIGVNIFGLIQENSIKIRTIVLIDRLSRHVWVFPQKKTLTTVNILKSLESVRKIDIKVKGKISDRGLQFTSNEWRIEDQKLGTKVKLAATHYPQTDGITERCILSLKQKVRLDPTSDSITSKTQQAGASLNSVESTTTTIAPKEMLEAYMRSIES
jgi:hypothetical protein